MIELEGVACVADLPRVQSIRRGGAPALVFEGRTTTFAEIDAMASRIANALIASGVRTQERVAYLTKNTDDFLIVLLGACKARVTLTPFNFRLAAPEIAHLIEDSGARLMMVGPDVADLADQAVAPLASKPPPRVTLGSKRTRKTTSSKSTPRAPPALPKGSASPTATTLRFSSSPRLQAA